METEQESCVRGRWATAREFARYAKLSVQTLGNWRHRDIEEGRDGPLPGYPKYRRWGSAVRYWIPEPEAE